MNDNACMAAIAAAIVTVAAGAFGYAVDGAVAALATGACAAALGAVTVAAAALEG